MGRTGQERSASRAVSPAALEQLEAVRDQWLQPLIDQIRELERERGRLIESDRRERIAREAAELMAEQERSDREEADAEIELLREILRGRNQ
jgi:hypothetical protein